MGKFSRLFLESSLQSESLDTSPDKFGTAHLTVSKRINHVLTRDFSIALIVNQVVTKPHIPPVVAVEGLLAETVGDEAFSDDMKQYTGWRIRLIVEALGGEWVKAGVRVNNSKYKTGSVYRFVSSPFEAFDAKP